MAGQSGSAQSLYHLCRHVADGRVGRRQLSAHARPTFYRESRCRSSSYSRPIAACRRRTWRRASLRCWSGLDALRSPGTIESRSDLGIGIIKVYFREQVDPDVAAGQVISLVNGEMQDMPPGMLPPSILKYDASGYQSAIWSLRARPAMIANCSIWRIINCATSWPVSRAWPRRRCSAACFVRCRFM